MHPGTRSRIGLTAFRICVLCLGCSILIPNTAPCFGFLPVPKSGTATFRRATGELEPDVPQQAVPGVQVAVDYSMTMEDGTVVASGPLQFVCGEGLVFPGLDKGVLGMTVGEKREFTFQPEDAYGLREDGKTLEVPLEQLPPECEIGRQLQLEGPNGQQIFAKVVQLSDTTVTIDYNHPLAGIPLDVSVTMVSLAQAPEMPDFTVETLHPGDGQTYPKPGDSVTVHYEGQLADGGASFDSTRERGEPFKFQLGVGQVIKGWDEAIPLMSLGERAKLHVPAVMAYGERGFGDVIPSNADLVFEVELLAIDSS